MLDFSRSPAPPLAHSLLLCTLLLAPLLASASTPCGGDPLLTLTVTAGEAVVAKDRQLIVRVHDDGCVVLHRPVFYRDAGDYQLRLEPAQWQALRQQIDALGGFDAAKTHADVRTRQAQRRKDGAAATMAIVDADRFALVWRIGSKQERADWYGLHDEAEQFPQIEALGRLSRTVAALQALALRAEAEKIAGAQP